MLRSLINGASGIKAQQAKMDIIANNIANVNTSAFKRSQVNFAEQVQKLTAGPATADIWDVHNGAEQILGNGAGVSQVDRDFSGAGSISTGRNLDLAIDGVGYFAVELSDGEIGYTRDGNLNLDKEGFLVTKQGYRLLPGVQFIEDYQDIIVEPNGEVRIISLNNSKGKKVGEIHLYKFKNDLGLAEKGENIFLATKSSGSAEEGLSGDDGYGFLKQGNLELSNVNLITEMAELIEAQRAYQVNARSLRTSDEMWGMTVNLRK